MVQQPRPGSQGQGFDFGESMHLLTLSSTEVNVVRQSFDLPLGSSVGPFQTFSMPFGGVFDRFSIVFRCF